MLLNINQPTNSLQDSSEEIESFIVFMFTHSLGKGIKARIKSLGCSWNTQHHGWLCPFTKQEAVIKALEDSNLNYKTYPAKFPKGMIPSDPKIAGRRSYLKILEKQSYEEDRQLLQDVYSYNLLLRPEDFITPLSEESKSLGQLRIEKDFYIRFSSLQEKKKEITRLRKELAHLDKDPEEKIFNSNAPLLIAKTLIQEHFLFEEERTLQYCSDSFWRWNGIKYIECEETAMRQIIYNFLETAKNLNDNGVLKDFDPNKFKVDQVVDALKALCYQSRHPSNGAIWLDDRKNPNPQYLISFQNGLLNIEDWIEGSLPLLIPHTPLLLNVNSLNFDFDPTAEEPKEWIHFLNKLWPEDLESQQTLQEWAGYLLLPDTTYHKILLMVGPPRSGKGTIGRALRELLGAFNTIGPTLSSLGGEFGLQPFLNKMLATISDARLNGKSCNNIIVERLLSISGEDPLTINRKFNSSITVQLPTRIMIMSNELPDLRDARGALVTRYLVLTFSQSWLGKEDTTLSQKLHKELPGILLWALQGFAGLKKRGKFIQPASSIETIQELEAITSPIRAFVTEECEIRPQGSVLIDSLFNTWRSWCHATGHPHTGNKQSFGKNLRAAFPEIRITRPQENLERERYYVGISLSSI